jgi:hypothetical protein
MPHKSSRAALVGLSTVAGAFAAAAMMSMASAPTAHADDMSEILANVTAEEGYASAAFQLAESDFSTGGESGIANGLTEYFVGLDDETAGIADQIHTGLIDALYQQPVGPADTFEFSITTPTIADYVTEAQNYYNTGMTDLTTYANDFTAGEVAQGVPFQDLGAIDIGGIPSEVEFVGTVESLLAILPPL